MITILSTTLINPIIVSTFNTTLQALKGLGGFGDCRLVLEGEGSRGLEFETEVVGEIYDA